MSAFPDEKVPPINHLNDRFYPVLLNIGRSYALQFSHLVNMELFRLFRGISNLVALFVPLGLFVFYMLTSALMFTLLDEKLNFQKLAWADS